MIPTDLQDFLKEDMEEIFKGYQVYDIRNVMVPLNIYKQNLPAKKGKNDDSHFPYIIIRIQDGEDLGIEEPNTCRILFIIGIYDENENYQGYKDVLNIIDKIYYHLMNNKTFQGKYQIQYPLNWSVTEEDYYPFYFGGIETNWNIGKVIQKDDEFI